jgi:hypothetical protein
VSEADRYANMLEAIRADERYKRNITWGEPRSGHPEGTIEAHIRDLELNLETLRSRLSQSEYWRLRVLIHVHDTFKAEAPEGIPINAPNSHASLARKFVAEFTDDVELLNIVQYHDEPFALFQRKTRGRGLDRERLKRLLSTIHEWDLYVAFLIIDGGTAGKSGEQLHWFFRELKRNKVQTHWTSADIIQR